jgi:hypothetical protein
VLSVEAAALVAAPKAILPQSSDQINNLIFALDPVLAAGGAPTMTS